MCGEIEDVAGEHDGGELLFFSRGISCVGVFARTAA